MDIELTVECHLSDAEDESIVKMTAGTTVYAAASSPLPKELNQEERREYMLSNLIALTYSHAKSHIMSITALSLMNALILPAILPSEMVKIKE